MASYSIRFARHAPAAVAVLTSSWSATSPSSCDAAPKTSAGMDSNETGDFHNLFPKRQLWKPKVEYPLWDKNWDLRHPEPTGDEEEQRQKMRKLRKEGVTRHIILVRHGQYDETHDDDSKRILTEIGRKQANYTGKRLRAMLEGFEEFGPCKINVVRVSGMARAKESTIMVPLFTLLVNLYLSELNVSFLFTAADIIASHLPGVERPLPDADLNEGRPSHNIPGGKASASTIKKTDEHHPRIENAFKKYFHRAPPPEEDDNGETTTTKHEFEIIVCHANVIRYFFCRALQLPPEAWLRLCTFNCSLTYLTIRPTGTVSCRMLGDVGHIPYGLTTFSGHPGFNW